MTPRHSMKGPLMTRTDSFLRPESSTTILSLAAAIATLAGWILLWRWTRPLWLTLEPAGNLPHAPWEVAGIHPAALVLVFFLLMMGYVLGSLVLARRPEGKGNMLLLAACCAGLVFAFLLFPAGSPDAFHYVAEARRFVLHHPNPYLATPSEILGDPIVRSFDFLPDAPLGYGPIWLYLTALPGRFTGYSHVIRTLFGLKCLNTLLLLASARMISTMARNKKDRRLRTYLFLANPLVLYEGLGNVHNDVMQAFFIILSLFFLSRKIYASSAAFAAGCLVKFFPLFLAPVMLFEGVIGRWNFRQWAAALAGALSAVILAFLPFWAGGRGLSGLIRGVTGATGPFTSASLVSLAREYLGLTGMGNLQASLLFGVLYLLMLCLTLFLRHRGTSLPRCLNLAYMAFLLLISLHYPWYLIPGIALLVLSGTSALEKFFLVLFTAGGLLYYPVSLFMTEFPGMTSLGLHLGQALLITVPVLAWLLASITLELAAEQGMTR